MIQTKKQGVELIESLVSILTEEGGSPVRFMYQEMDDYHFVTIDDAKIDFIEYIKVTPSPEHPEVWEIFTQPEGGLRWRETDKSIRKDTLEWVEE